VQFAKMLSSNVYTKYIKDPFNNKTTMSYLRKLCHIPKTPHPIMVLFYHFGISFESLTLDIGPLEKGVHFIDARHYNASLIVPRLVYVLSTKLKGDVAHKCLG
jgi:hypothetical protein